MTRRQRRSTIRIIGPEVFHSSSRMSPPPNPAVKRQVEIALSNLLPGILKKYNLIETPAARDVISYMISAELTDIGVSSEKVEEILEDQFSILRVHKIDEVYRDALQVSKGEVFFVRGKNPHEIANNLSLLCEKLRELEICLPTIR